MRHQKVLQSAVDNADAADDATPATVGNDDIVKGYEYAKGQNITIEPAEIANLRVPSKHSINVEQFVDENGHSLPIRRDPPTPWQISASGAHD